MFIYALLILVLWGGATATDDKCEEGGGGQMCRKLTEVGYFQFPQSEADIDRMCPLVLKFLDCLKDYEDECGAEKVDLINYSREQVEKLIDLTNDLCREDSQLRISLVSNLACIENRVNRSNCYEETMDDLEKLKNYIREIETEQDTFSDMWLDYQCLYGAMEIACYTSDISENCGKEAEDVSMEILIRVEHLDDYCSETSHESAIEAMKMLDLELEVETDLKNIFSTY
ncbi:uncharacterized protein CEXT_524121 [Caerostris extrusa]|uniref:DUF19 domain-containing protein n=1 Tax=Caerostris extrusa TaxID=172846 RepID=A0AAV4SLF5_CAEEX|nr:uncharacterized protein CEXT_524121 [Caerostris extrusa]